MYKTKYTKQQLIIPKILLAFTYYTCIQSDQKCTFKKLFLFVCAFCFFTILITLIHNIHVYVNFTLFRETYDTNNNTKQVPIKKKKSIFLLLLRNIPNTNQSVVLFLAVYDTRQLLHVVYIYIPPTPRIQICLRNIYNIWQTFVE